jgi:hypothetical protein
MKSLSAITILVVFLFSACKEYKVKTKVNEDGSIEKTVEVVSRNVIHDYYNLSIPLNESWTITQEKDSVDDVYRLVAKRKFDDVVELIDEYGSPGGTVIEVNHAIRGRWFYTYHEYEEIIEAANPFTTLKVEDYLTTIEYEQLKSGVISEELEERLDTYLSHAMIDDFTESLKKKMNVSIMNEVLWDNLKAELIKCIDSDDEVDCFVSKINEYYDGIEEHKLIELVGAIVGKIENRAEKFMLIDGEYIFSFQLPGLILETNSEAIEGPTVSWKFSSDNFAYTDYRMFAESRVINLWNFIITGFSLLVLSALLIYASIAKRNK